MFVIILSIPSARASMKRQSQLEGCALTQHTLCCKRAMMGSGDPLGDCQTETRTVRIDKTGIRGSIEPLKYMRQILWFDADTRVDDFEYCLRCG